MIPQTDLDTENLLQELLKEESEAKSRLASWAELLRKLPRVTYAITVVEDAGIFEEYGHFILAEIRILKPDGHGDPDFFIYFNPGDEAELAAVSINTYEEIGYTPAIEKGTWKEICEEVTKMLKKLISVPEPDVS